MHEYNKTLLGSNYAEGVLYAVFDGVAYRQSGWFGCQLQSIEKKKPKFNERRQLKNFSYCYEVEIFTYERIGFGVYECTWRLPQTCGYDEYAVKIQEMLDCIFNWKGLK